MGFLFPVSPRIWKQNDELTADDVVTDESKDVGTKN